MLSTTVKVSVKLGNNHSFEIANNNGECKMTLSYNDKSYRGEDRYVNAALTMSELIEVREAIQVVIDKGSK